jgi:hypothetical protein
MVSVESWRGLAVSRIEASAKQALLPSHPCQGELSLSKPVIQHFSAKYALY